jgi:hypothetical protein
MQVVYEPVSMWIPAEPRWPVVLTPTWLPPSRHLHYPELYRRIYEWLRAPPCLEYKAQAQEYLSDLMRCYHPLNMVQWHRIQWTVEWLRALALESGGGGEDDEHDSDADTVVGEG